ncbi:MAG: efflux RND transporter permease subunit, partial [Pseudomonadales bacterium]
VISLAGVAFAIGMTLDNSIVALENIARHLAMGKSRFAAALEGIQEVWPAILASTLTTLMVFLPVIFLKMEAGQLYSDIAAAIAVSILMSMLIAITLIPAASSRLLNLREVGSDNSLFGRLLHRSTHFGESIAARLLRATTWLLQRLGRQIWTLVITLFVTLSILLFMIPAAEYLPEGEESKIFGRMLAPPGYNIQTMLDVWRKIDPEFSSQVGASAEAFDAGEVAMPPLNDQLVILRAGSMTFITEPLSAKYTPALIDVATDRFQAIPGMRSFVVRGSIFSDNRGGTRSINIELTGRNLEKLYATALTVFDRADDLFEGAQLNADPPPPTLNMSQPIARIVPDWERAAELNIGQDELGYSVWAYSDGAFVDEFFLDDDKIDMYLFASTGIIKQPSDLENVMLYTSEGQQVPLSAVARVEETVGTSDISRIDALRTVTLQIIPPRSIALENAVKIVQSDLLAPMRAENEIPAEITVDITGATSELEKTRAALSGNFALAILIAYLLLVAVFSHWGFPLIIMTTVPIGISGGILGLWLYNLVGDSLGLLGLQPIHQPFDIITMLGFLILIGTVVNNPILIVERSVNNLKAKGMEIAEAILEAIKVRLRPVMMSSLTTVFGLSPLVLLPGAGSELYRGLGAIVLFGLLFSSIVTLTILPVILSLVFHLRECVIQSGWKNLILGSHRLVQRLPGRRNLKDQRR